MGLSLGAIKNQSFGPMSDTQSDFLAIFIESVIKSSTAQQKEVSEVRID